MGGIGSHSGSRILFWHVFLFDLFCHELGTLAQHCQRGRRRRPATSSARVASGFVHDSLSKLSIDRLNNGARFKRQSFVKDPLSPKQLENEYFEHHNIVHLQRTQFTSNATASPAHVR